MVLVGALNVSSISTCWHGEVTGPDDQVTHVDYPGPDGHDYGRGNEMGQFNLGSTVILVTGAGGLRWRDELKHGIPVQVGQALATAAG